MPQEHCCGPDHDADFFEAIAGVMRRFPKAAKKYAVKCIDHETDLMKVDFKKRVGLSRIVGKRVTTEFVDARRVASRGVCCLWWYYKGRIRCVAYWL